MTDNIVPFGKYRGQPVEVMMADRAYCEWALAQPSIRERYPTFVTIVVNGGSAPDSPTPEHNKLQLLFRDPAMRVATYYAVVGADRIWEQAQPELLGKDSLAIEAGNAAHQAALDRAEAVFEKDFPEPPNPGWDYYESDSYTLRDAYREWCDRRRAAGSDEAKAAGAAAARRKAEEIWSGGEWAREKFREARVEFECSGWDARIIGPWWISALSIELKPQMGDDYPAVLRKMKLRRADGKRVLIVDRFEAEGASLDDVRWIFSQSGIEVRTLAEIRAAMTP